MGCKGGRGAGIANVLVGRGARTCGKAEPDVGRVLVGNVLVGNVLVGNAYGVDLDGAGVT